MLIDITPLKKNHDFRWLYYGQFVSIIGSMVSYVAVPFQVYTLTKDNAIVGALGVVQLVPLIVFSLLGGTYADRMNRQKLLIGSEIAMIFFTAILAWNAYLPNPSVTLIFVVTAILQAFNGFHRPAMEAITQKIVPRDQFTSAGALTSLRYSISSIAGPSLGGILIAHMGIGGAYVLDAATFLVAVLCIFKMTKIPAPEKTAKSPLEDMKAGVKFAFSKPELMGTYIIDIVAMIFAFPLALFPAMADKWGGAKVAGWLFSAMSVGALIATLFSGWCNKVEHRGRGVIWSAAFWGIFMIGLGFTSNPEYPWIFGFWGAFLFLVAAGCADMYSGLFRKVIWNDVVPNSMRGRLSGIEMISYMSGPLLGNARAGWMADKTSVPSSLTIGGYLCVAGVVLTAFLLPKFWAYRSEKQ